MGHLAGCQAGHVGQQVSSQALEYLRLLEAEFAFGIERAQGSPSRVYRLPWEPPSHPSLALSSGDEVSVTKFIPEAQQRGPGPMGHCVSVAASWASTGHGVGGHRI